MKTSQEAPKGHSRTRNLGCPELLDQLPALQQLLLRLVGCQPEGAARGNYLIQYALALILKESFKIYCAINDGIINLVDMFFEMSKYDAVKALEIYKRAGQQEEDLSDFYELCKGLELARNFQFPTLRQPPPSFLATMQEYIKEAPKFGSLSSKTLEYQEKNLLTYKQEAAAPPPESPKPAVEDEKPSSVESEEPPEPISEPASQSTTTGDLLGLDEINPAAAKLEQSNALALAIISPCDDAKASTNNDLFGSGTNASGWELALVTTPSTNNSHLVESKLAGGFDRLLLDSLYEDSARRQQILAANPFDTTRDPFAMSKSIAPPSNVEMAMMAQQQQQYYQQQQQQMMLTMMPHASQPQYPHSQLGLANPFGDPFVGFSQGTPPQGNPRLL